MKKSLQKSLKGKMLCMTVLPMIGMAILILVSSLTFINHSMQDTQREKLEKNVHYVVSRINELYPGDYELVGDLALYLYKGEQIISDNATLLDAMKDSEEIELTLFYQDTRILTTLRDESGVRCVGTGASPIVVRDVLQAGEAVFYPSVDLNGRNYGAYYLPVYHSDGNCVGMVAASCPVQVEYAAVVRYVTPLIGGCIFAIAAAVLISMSYTNGLLRRLNQLKTFLYSVSQGNLTAELSEKILKSSDEIGELGRLSLEMQGSLRRMIEMDELTQINNRRYGQKRLEQAVRRSGETGAPCCVAVGDIDFFKKVNDTYGHEAGDAVLVEVAAALRAGMMGKGFAARWGGEEFLLVFEHDELEESVKTLERIRETIESLNPVFEGTTIPVTISVGVARLMTEENVDEGIKRADACLYRAKKGGRNQVISEKQQGTEPEDNENEKDGI